MLKGDIGLKSIFAIVLSLMVLSLLISVSSVGSLGGALLQGFDEVGQFTDRTVEVEDKETLSDLTRFVQHRAEDEGCLKVDDINEEGGYEHLEGSHLTSTPTCFGGEAGYIRDPPQNVLDSPDENYMTGIFSREQFEIKENNNLTFNSASGDTRLDDNIGGFADTTLGTVEENTDYTETSGGGIFSAATAAAGGAVGAAFGGVGAGVGAGGGYAVGRVVESAWDDRQPTTVAEAFIIFEDSSVDLHDRVNTDDFDDLPEDPDDFEDALDDLERIVWFCEGDKGYIQSNRGTIGNSDGTSSQEPLYPIIVVEESEHSECGSVDLDRSDKIPDNTATSGRVLYITGRTDETHPYVRGPATGGTDRNYAFDFHQLNENQPEISNIFSLGRNIDITYNADRSNECVIGMYDHRSSAVDAAGYITLERGAHIEQDGSFPPRSSGIIGVDSLEDRSDRSVPPYPNTKALYDTYASEGFTGGNWENSWDVLSVNDKILYDYAGERRFELYGDLLCAPHSNNNNFEDNHSEWKMCSHNQDDVTVNGNTWSCDSSSGKWEGETQDSCEPDEFECGNGQCVDDPEDCSGGF